MTESIIKEINEFREASDNHWSEIMKQYEYDVRFSKQGKHWDEKTAQKRKLEGRPCLTFNKIPAFMRQVTNEQRMNKPRIVVKPSDDKADVETAKIINGMVRAIETSSSSDYAYDTAIDCAVSGGLGFIYIATDYVDDLTFEQDIVFRRCVNPKMVKFDPMSTQPDGSDQMACIIEEVVREEVFKQRYPKADTSNFDDQWVTEGGIIVGRYWKINTTDDVLLLMSDNSAVLKSSLDADEELKAYYSTMGVVPTDKTRKVQRRSVKQIATNGTEIFEESDWPSIYIPVVPVYGEEVWIDDKREYKSLHRDAQDAQRSYDYFRTMFAESVGLQSRAPYLGKVGTFESDRNKWQTVNSENHPFLEYDDEMPQRQGWIGVDSGSMQEAMNCSEDMKAIMGIYDASLGNRSNETSGVAIAQRKSQAGVQTYHFSDNLNRSIRQCGRIIVDLIPKIYDTPRIVRVLGDDYKTEETIKINDQTDYNGRVALFDVRVGKYDVTVDTGPSFSTRREEVAAQITEIMRSAPDTSSLLMDIIAENSDWPNSEKVAKRFAAMLPESIKHLEQEVNDDPAQLAMQRDQLAEQLQQAEEAIDQLKAMLQEAQSTQEDSEAMIELKKQQEINKGKLLDLQKQKELTSQKQAEMLASQFSSPDVGNLTY